MLGPARELKTKVPCGRLCTLAHWRCRIFGHRRGRGKTSSHTLCLWNSRRPRPYTDVLIIYCGPGKKYNWVVCHTDDDEYEFEIISRGVDYERP